MMWNNVCFCLQVDAHAAYGPFHHTQPGETLFTTFEIDANATWTLTMGVVGDAERVSVLRVPQPFVDLFVC